MGSAHDDLSSLRNSSRGGIVTAPRGFTAPANDEIARKRAAFLAAERARQSDNGLSEAAVRYGNTAERPVRSLPMAYLLWFILGQVSAHRFYLGAYKSAMIQVGMFVFCILLALGSSKGAQSATLPVAAVALVVWAVWVLGDVFFIHRIHRQNCRRPGEVANVFA